MRKYLLLIICLSCFSGCEKRKEDQDNIVKLPDDIYVGTFKRELSWSDNYTANVTLTFLSNTWTGTSNITKYPALCKGTYSIKGDTITFENSCAWTAEFDWSLILSGKYFIIINEDSITFHRNYHRSPSDTFTDRYKMKRQKK